MTHLSLFSGIGGLDLAAEWAGFTTVGQCEWADYPTKVLEKHWPDVPRWRDVRDLTAADFTARTGLRTVDCISGGFPCQPHSVAGKRKASADERDLWPEYRRIIGEIKPRWVVAENVPGLLSSEDGRFFRNILRDFAEMGFDVGWATFPASWVGAIHRRERMAIVAYSNKNRHEPGVEGLFAQRRNMGRCERDIFADGRFKTQTYWPPEITEEKIVNKAELFCMDDGVSTELDEIGCYGNAVVPAQFYPIFKAIWEIEHEA